MNESQVLSPWTAEPLWTARQLATFWGCSPSKIYKDVEAGRIPCIRLGALLRFDPAAIRRLTDAAGVPATDSQV